MKLLISLWLLLAALTATAQKQTNSKFETGDFYQNPVFAGDYPDPSLLKDGDDYYLVHSSFDYYPGLLIWHSTDLINWSPVTNALHTYVGPVWAPDLVKYAGKYYLYFPANNTNYVVWADAVEGPWSEPVDLKIGNIDPGHVADDAGNRYLYFSSGDYVPLSKDGLSVAGEPTRSYAGWPIPRDWSIELFALEGPKITRHGDYWYLTVAEGGTAGPPTGHMIVSARSKSPLGPWENSPYNPIVRTQNKAEQWWSKGHGTLFEDRAGNWWIVFHGYERDYLNMGRQTLLEPVEWTADGWFRVPAAIETGAPMKRPAGIASPSSYTLSDDFSGTALKPHWKFFGEYKPARFKVSDNRLLLAAKGQGVSDCSPLLCVPADHAYTAEVEIDIEGHAVAGLVLFYNSSFYSGILADSANILANLRGWQFPAVKAAIDRHVFLRLKNIENTVDLYYSTDGLEWTKIESSLEVSGYNHNVLSGFMGLRIGLCAIGNGSVRFRNFRYKAIQP